MDAFQVDDINAHLKKAKELGGKVVEKKTEIGGNMGYYGILQDPSETRSEYGAVNSLRS